MLQLKMPNTLAALRFQTHIPLPPVPCSKRRGEPVDGADEGANMNLQLAVQK
jgi:hypothetical protein